MNPHGLRSVVSSSDQEAWNHSASLASLNPSHRILNTKYFATHWHVTCMCTYMFQFDILCFLSPPITPAVPVISVPGQEFKSALFLIVWYIYLLLFVAHLETVTAHAKSKGRPLEHLQKKQDARGFGTISPIIERVSRIIQVEKHSPKPLLQPRLSYHHTLTTTEPTASKEHLCWGEGPEV